MRWSNEDYHFADWTSDFDQDLAARTRVGSHVVWAPQEGPQTAFVQCPFFDVMFGGARGGGKSDGCLGEFALHAKRYKSAARGVFMRREMPQADSLIDRSHEIFRPLGWEYGIGNRQWTSPDGAILRFRPLEGVKDAAKYQGQDFSRVYIEELTHWASSDATDMMKATLRSARGARVGFRATANPGGPGHNWVKARYIDPAPFGNEILLDEAGEFDRVFIPSKVTDNKILLEADPRYTTNLHLVGSPELVKRWLEGDWSVIEGAFFDNWSVFRHVVPPFDPPKTWTRFRSMDWGSARPFSVGWYAVASDDFKVPNSLVTLPRGGLYKYREWYGMQPNRPNVGLKMTVEAVAAKIREYETGDKVDYGVIDPAAFAENGGPSIAERMALPPNLIRWQPGDNTRVGVAKDGTRLGWDLIRHRLDGEEVHRPMLILASTCVDSIRTVPSLQHDKRRLEDVDTNSEDHAGDELRYACASRPWSKPTPQPEPPIVGMAGVTLTKLWKMKQRENRRV